MATIQRRRRNYNPDEVRVLVEEHEELRCVKGTERWKLELVCQLLDMRGAVSRLGPKEYQAVLLVGLLSLSDTTAAELMGVSRSTMWSRYTRGLEMLTTDLNGGR